MRLSNLKLIVVLVVSAFYFAVGPRPALAQYPNGYLYSRVITIDHTKVPNTDQSNFPVLISGTYSYLATTSNGGNVTNSNGYDIIFTSDPNGATVLSYERENYSASTGAASFWVKIPTLSHIFDTTIYVFYGNSSVTTDQSNATGVWDSSFQGVWHLENGTTLSANDSTSNGNNGTVHGGVSATTGEIGGAGSFDGSSGYISTGFTMTLPTVLTSEVWINTTSTSGTKVDAFESNQTGTGSTAFDANIYVNTSGHAVSTCYNGSLTTIPYAIVNDGNWHHLVVTYDSSPSMTMYIDGQWLANVSCASSWGGFTGYFRIGSYVLGPWPSGNDGYFNGMVDEVRVSNSVRSSDWIATEYNNLHSPSTFYTVGSATPTISSLLPTFGSVGTAVTITGANLGTSGTVTFNGTTATSIASWSETSITVTVPSGATTGQVVVTPSTGASNGVNFRVIGPEYWSNGYSFNRAITIDHTKVPNTDRWNFPMLISGTYSYLATISNGGNVTNSNGYDIIFTSDAAGTTTLPFERTSYTASSGTVMFWVQVPTVSHTSDTTIYMFYGNSSVTTDQSNATGVWDSNYKGVWHLPDGSTLSMNDSTSNGNNGTNHSASAASGKIDGGANTNGNSYIDAGNSSSLAPTSAITMSFWADHTSGSFKTWEAIFTKGDNTYHFQLCGVYSACYGGSTANAFDCAINGPSGTNDLGSTVVPSTNTWYYVACTYDGSTQQIYVNGTLNESQSRSGSISTNSYDVALGENLGATGRQFSGILDEVRISNTARSADWIATEYNNQNSPSTFYTVGSAVSDSNLSITSLSPYSGDVGSSVTITGIDFGSSQGSSIVAFNATPATSIASWSNTSITATVPSGATTGEVVVTVPGIGASNGVNFEVTGVGYWSNGYNYTRAITIDHTKVPNTNQINFPVLISGTYSYLATVVNGGNVTNSNGYDVIFTSDAEGTTILPFERESYNASTGAVNFWVQIPTVSHTSNTTIYMFYGNSSITADPSNVTGAWDSNYVGVWHLENGSTLSGNDSTSNGYKVTNNNSTAATTGEIGGAASFNGSNNYLSNSSLSVSSGSSITISFWNYVTSGDVQASSAFTIGNSENPNRIQANVPWSDSNLYWDYGSWSGGGRVSTSYSSYLGSWTYVALKYDGTTHSIYLNGSLAASSSNSNAPTSTQSGIDIGAFPYDSDYHHGNMDEFRVSKIARSADWIATEYNNQGSPSTFYAIGAAESQGNNSQGGGSGPTITSLSPTSGPVTTSVTITGTNFRSTQGSSAVTFNGTAATSISSWGATSITAAVPSGATTGGVIVTVSGNTSNGVDFTVTGVGNGYSYSRTITIDHTKVPNTDQANFPVLLSGTYPYLATTGNGGNVTNSNGYDIIFSLDSTGATVLPFERESYSASTGAAIFWVQVPIVSHASNTNIYMFYGNSSVTTDQSNSTGVWDSNYKGVWHLENGTTLTATDSSANGYNGTISGATATTGQIGGGGSFNGSSNKISISTTGSLYTPFTIEAWANPATLSGGLGLLGSRTPNDESFDVQVNGAGVHGDFGTGSSWSTTSADGSFASPATIWHHVVYTVTSTGYTIYGDGSQIGSGSLSSSSLLYDSNHTLQIGWNGYSSQYFNGAIDEVRISNSARSADWIATEYNNQSSPSTFYAVGPVNNWSGLTGPTISSISPTSGPVDTSVTITGTDFGSAQGSSFVTFNDRTAVVSSWSSTSITAAVPVGATTGDVVVVVSGVASNGPDFTVTGPTITNLSPTEGPTGTSVVISGVNFGSSIGSSTVTFNGTPVTSYGTWSDTSIPVTVPSGATTGDVVVTVSGAANGNDHSFTVTSSSSGPTISSLSPTQGPVTTSVTITGTNFGSTKGSSTVQFDGTTASTTAWGSTSITATVPSGATTGDVIVTVSSTASNGADFTVTGSGSSDIYYYFSDALGTARVITAADGTVCYDADTYPYGGERAYADNCDSAYKFTGKERDPESNLDNSVARYYTAQYARFTSPDPTVIFLGDLTDPQQLNLYSYVRNNPLKFIDPVGLDCVYLNDAGDGLDPNGGVDTNSSSEECAQTQGIWFNGSIDINSIQFDPNSDWVFAQGTSGTSQFSCGGNSCGQDALTPFVDSAVGPASPVMVYDKGDNMGTVQSDLPFDQTVTYFQAHGFVNHLIDYLDRNHPGQLDLREAGETCSTHVAVNKPSKQNNVSTPGSGRIAVGDFHVDTVNPWEGPLPLAPLLHELSDGQGLSPSSKVCH